MGGPNVCTDRSARPHQLPWLALLAQVGVDARRAVGLDRVFDGRPFRILTVVDCHTREALSLTPRANVRAYQVAEALDALVRLRGRPKSLRVD